MNTLFFCSFAMKMNRGIVEARERGNVKEEFS